MVNNGKSLCAWWFFKLADFKIYTLIFEIEFAYLDKYLETLPDEPKVGDSTPSACAKYQRPPLTPALILEQAQIEQELQSLV